MTSGDEETGGEWNSVVQDTASLLVKADSVFSGLARFPFELEEGTLAHYVASMGGGGDGGKEAASRLLAEEYHRATRVGIEILDDIDAQEARVAKLLKKSGMTAKEVSEYLEEIEVSRGDDEKHLSIHDASNPAGMAKILARFYERESEVIAEQENNNGGDEATGVKRKAQSSGAAALSSAAAKRLCRTTKELAAVRASVLSTYAMGKKAGLVQANANVDEAV